MENIVGYDSDDSVNSPQISIPRDVKKDICSNVSGGDILAAEYENFEKLICGDSSIAAKESLSGDGKNSQSPVSALNIFSKSRSSGESSHGSDSDDSGSEYGGKKKKESSGSASSSPHSHSADSSEESDVSNDESNHSDVSSEEDNKTPEKSKELKRKASRDGWTSSPERKTKKEDQSTLAAGKSETEGKRTTDSHERRYSDHRKHTRRRSRSHSPSRKRHSSSPRKSQDRRSRSKGRERRSSTSKRSPDRERGKHRSYRDRKHRTSHRSRSRSRHRRRSSSRDRHHGRSRGHRKLHSPSRRSRHRRSKERRRSRSRSRDRRGSHHHRKRSHSRNRRSRSRSKERKRVPFVRDEGKKKPMTFKELMKQQMLEVQRKASDGTLDELLLENKSIPGGPNERPSSIALKTAHPLAAMAMAGQKITPQQALLQTMAAMHKKAQELTGVAVPNYYNPAAVNPLKYAEQVQKRKLLWSKSKDTKDIAEALPTTSVVETPSTAASSSSKPAGDQWGGTAFHADQDGKMAAKFRKLMGMKPGEENPVPEEEEANEAQMKKQDELFQQLDKEYEFARMTTHTHRGIGLGFQSQGLPPYK